MKITKFSGFRFAGALGGLALVCCLLAGCSNPEEEARETLESKGYEAEVDDLLLAAESGDAESLELFRAGGVDIESTDGAGNTALIEAAGGGHAQVVEKLLGFGADPGHVNDVGRDALLAASSKGFDEVARLLVSRGADPSIKDAKGWSALSIAAYNRHSEVVSLLASEVEPEALDDALLVASFSGDAEVIGTLLGHGANINVRSPRSQTPLMIAAEGGKHEAVRVLLQNKANPYSEDDEGNTAAKLAEASGFDEVRELIENPDSWGSTPESEEIEEEMKDARRALAAGDAVEETLNEPGTEAAPGESDGGRASRSGSGGGSKEESSPAGAGKDGRNVASSGEGARAEDASFARKRDVSSPDRNAASRAGHGGRAGGESRVGGESRAAQADPGHEATPRARGARVASAGGGTVEAGEGTTAGASSAAEAPVPDADDRIEARAPGGSEATAASSSRGSGAAAVGASVAARASAGREANASGGREHGRESPDLRHIREQARSKPVAALDGSTIRSRSPEQAPVETMVLAGYHEEPLPIAVETVRGEKAEIRRLDREESKPVEVEPGSDIPGTSYAVEEVTPKYVSSKEGKGRMTDVSRVRVKDKTSGSTHLLLRGVSGRSSDTYAILTAPGSRYRYVVKPGDVFHTSQLALGPRDYQVLDIRGSGVVIKDLATDEALTVARDGIVEP